MKRTAAILLILCLMLGSVTVLAEMEPSPAAITIDGIRTAFFDENGAYLSPLTRDELVYVPVLSLAESLGLEATADADTLSVTVNGVRTAFFSGDGAYLAPVNVDGTVYVPLVAFAESVGLTLTVDGDSYALERSDGAATEPESTEQPPLELYGNVPLTLGNYRDFFVLSQDYYAPKDYPSPYQITFTASIAATTGYDLVNVVFDLENYGIVRVPATGQATARYKSEKLYSYQSSSKKEYILAVGRMQTSAILTASSAPRVNSVGGYIRMSKAEADEINERLYQSAVSSIERAKAPSELDDPIALLNTLDGVNYSDSNEQAKAAREKKTVLAAEAEAARIQAEEEEKAAKYAEAEAFVAAGEYEKAFQAFEELGDYSDSADRATEAEELLYAPVYESAEQMLAEGDFDGAIGAFEDLKKADYRDSSQRLDEAKQAKTEAVYQEAESLMADGEYSSAIDRFKDCHGYSDSALQVQACYYLWAESLEASEDYDGAIKLYEDKSLKGYKDSAERAASAKAKKQAAEERAEQARLEGIYRDAQALVDAGDFGGALARYRQCAGYQDADSRAEGCVSQLWKDVRALLLRGEHSEAEQLFHTMDGEASEEEFSYQKGVALYATGDYQAALEVFEGLRGFGDVDDILDKDVHLAPLAWYDQFSVGSIARFGSDESTGESMEWYVLDVQEDRVFLLSRYVLSDHNIKFGISPVKGWPESPLRKYLNEKYFNTAFSESEKKQILKTRLTNLADPMSGKPVKFKDTEDIVFLLSYEEFAHYLASDGAGRKGEANSSTMWFVFPQANDIAPATPPPKDDGETPEYKSWWLRDMNSVQNPKCNFGEYVWTELNEDGSTTTNVGSQYIERNCFLRPAMWIKPDFNTDQELVEMIHAEAPDSEASDSGEDAAEAASEESVYATLQKGDRGDEVKALQQKLIELGYLTGKADGDYGNKTREAVAAFQKDAGFPQTGVADSETQAAVFAG